MSEDSRQFGTGAFESLSLELAKLLLVVLSLICVANRCQASEPLAYPSRPIRLVVPWPPGGGADSVGRAIAQELTGALGRQVIVDNRPGASGIIGTEIVARAQPDGYTLLLPTVTTGTNPIFNRKLPYDTEKDFRPVVLVASSPYLLAVNPLVAAQSVSDLIMLAKAKPNQLNYASTGNGSAPHLIGEWFKMLTQASIVHVPYKGGTPALTDLIGGQMQMAFGNIANYLPQARAGKVRILAVTSAKRTSQAPELPTMIESGVTDFITGTWFGVQVPVGTPQLIIDRLNGAINKLLASQELPRRFALAGADPIGGTPQQFADFVRTELTRWASVIRAAGISID